MKKLSVSINFNGKNINFIKRDIKIPSYWYRGRIKHWHERYGVSYTLWHHLNSGRGLENGDPSVIRRITKSDEVLASLTPDIERWLFKLLLETSFYKVDMKTVLSAYRNLFAGNRAYTDYSGWETNQSIILNENIGAEPMRMGYGIPNGATVMVVGNNEIRMIKGLPVSVTPVMALDVLNPKTLSATYYNSPYTIQCATNCVTEPQPYGIIDPFPVLGERGYSTPIPLLSQGTNKIYIETEWIEKLPEGKEGRQYPYYKTNYTNIKW